MCSIVASFSRTKLIELVDLNVYRGNLNSSITYFDRRDDNLKIDQWYGAIDAGIIDPPRGAFTVIHQQAPTGNNVRDNKKQPAQYYDLNIHDRCFLWHNGILKDAAVEYLQKKLDNPETWDTQLLLEEIVKYEFESLSKIDGSFSCILFMRGYMYIFRNELAPMFYNDEFDFSSTEFEGSRELDPNVVFAADVKNKILEPIYEFSTFNNPYKFEEKKKDMAWWDHEELKSPENRSDRYKVTFPTEYTETEVTEAQARINKEKGWAKDAEAGEPLGVDMSDMKWQNVVPKGATTVAVDAYGDYIRQRLDEDAENAKKSTDSPSLPTDQKFGEAKYIDEITEYLAGTYSAHYAQGKVQAFELVDSAGLADGFTMGSVIKYASRYGKKNGHNRKDLLKIIHYAMLQLYVHDKNGYDNKG